LGLIQGKKREPFGSQWENGSGRKKQCAQRGFGPGAQMNEKYQEGQGQYASENGFGQNGGPLAGIVDRWV
jgi:hypothetical protein